MTRVARYIIVLDRTNDDEIADGRREDGHDWPETDQQGVEQVARELQEAMDQAGIPAGCFRVIARTEPENEGDSILNCSPEEAHRRARAAILDTTTY